MEGGASLLLKRRVRSFGRFIPLSWWLPQKERAVLAVASTLFWTSSTMQALYRDTEGASILAFYGLGLAYVVCGMGNIAGGLRTLLSVRPLHRAKREQARALLQLFAVLASMIFFNIIVLAIYLQRGATPTPLDWASLALAGIIFGILITRHGLLGCLSHPLARGFLAIACKALPQILLAGLFILHPLVAGAFTIWSLAALTTLASLRFWPSFLAYKRDPESLHMRGLLLGEGGNMISIAAMIGAWSWATLLS